MPTYEYECQCGITIELLKYPPPQKIKCKAGHAAKRIFSNPKVIVQHFGYFNTSLGRYVRSNKEGAEIVNHYAEKEAAHAEGEFKSEASQEWNRRSDADIQRARGNGDLSKVFYRSRTSDNRRERAGKMVSAPGLRPGASNAPSRPENISGEN